MNQPRTLDPIIRRIESKQTVSTTAQTLITLDANGRPLHPFRRWLPWANQRHYLVTNASDRSAVARAKDERITVHSANGSGNLDVIIAYEARCPPGKERVLAKVLGKSGAPLEQALLDQLVTWVETEIGNELGDFLADRRARRATLAAELSRLAREHLGLEMVFTLDVADAKRLEQQHFRLLQVGSELSDWDEKIDLDVELRLGVLPGHELDAYRAADGLEEQKRELRALVEGFISTSVTLHQFQIELQTKTRQRLEARLGEHVGTYGRRIDKLILQAVPFSVKAWVDEKIIVDFRPREFPRALTVESHVLLSLQDTGKYFRAGKHEIKSWLTANVGEVVREALFGLTYQNLWQTNEAKKAEIETKLRARVEEIGYEVRQITTITDLEAELLKGPIPIHIKGEFFTRLAKYDVGLEIYVDATLESREHIPDLLTRYENVTASMTEILRRRIEQKMHTIDPENFYLEFEVVRAPALNSPLSDNPAIPVRQQLEQVIETTLRDELKCSAANISCKQSETEISKIYDQLLRQRFSFEIEAHFDLGQPALSFEGRFQVLSVDEHGWQAFRSAQPLDLETLRKSFSGYVLEELRNVGFRELLYATPQQLKKLAENHARGVCEEFGLVTRITHLAKRGQGNQKLMEQSEALWQNALATQIERQKIYEQSLRDLTDKHVALLQQGQVDEANQIASQIAQLERSRRKNRSEIPLMLADEATSEPTPDTTEEPRRGHTH
ncbi:MAG: hypothetical protein HC897_19165 [Thermoanaerobaculia bacterium]|nr:hypothetical protein [Thermoanaerobaculia bacterium]